MNGMSIVPELTSAQYSLSEIHCGFGRTLHTAGPRKAYGSVIRNAEKAPTRTTPKAVTPSKNWFIDGRPLRGHTRARPSTGSNINALTLQALASPARTPA